MSTFNNYLANGAKTLKTPGIFGMAAYASFSFFNLSTSSYYYLAISSYKFLGYY